MKIYIDGSCNGNPGPMRIAVLSEDGEIEHIESIGSGTNNVAEYSALIKALEIIESKKLDEVTIFTDSELMYRQMKGEYKVKAPHLKPLHQEALKLAKTAQCKLRLIPRKENIADSLFH